MPKFSDVLTLLRKEENLSQHELAKNLGLSRSAVSMYETGQREPDFETLEIFADYFNVDMDYLTGRSTVRIKTPILDEVKYFGVKLRTLRYRLGLKQEDVANGVNLSKAAISLYENGKREPDFETVEKFADYFNVSMSTFFPSATTPEGFPANILPLPKMRSVPLLGTIACGDPILAEENVEGFLAMPEHVSADFALRCKGDSMINARIFDGDIVYIRQQPTVEDGEIAAVLIDNEATLKRVHFYADRIALEPANPMYPLIVKSGEEMATVRILGKAVAFTSAVR